MTTFIGLEENSIINQKGVKEIWQIYHFPIFELYECIYQSDNTGLNEKLESYIMSKKENIIQNIKNDDPNHWIDFNLLGVLSTANRN